MMIAVFKSSTTQPSNPFNAEANDQERTIFVSIFSMIKRTNLAAMKMTIPAINNPKN